MSLEPRLILVTGATGFVGAALLEQLEHADFKSRAAIRELSHYQQSKNDIYTIGDINGDNDWTECLDKVTVVVHLAARVHIMNDSAKDPLAEFRKTNVDGTLNLARQAAKAGVKRFIFISSVKVNGENTLLGTPFKETDNPNPKDNYGLSKLEAERGLWLIAQQTGMDIVIIRPPLVYGIGVKANFATMMRVVKKGIPLPFGLINNKRSLIYVENLVSLIICCIDHAHAANQLFLASDGYDLSTPELIRACARAIGVKARLINFPPRLLELTARIIGKTAVMQRLCGNLQVDIAKAKIMLNWVPPVTVEDGFKVTMIDLIKDK